MAAVGTLVVPPAVAAGRAMRSSAAAPARPLGPPFRPPTPVHGRMRAAHAAPRRPATRPSSPPTTCSAASPPDRAPATRTRRTAEVGRLVRIARSQAASPSGPGAPTPRLAVAARRRARRAARAERLVHALARQWNSRTRAPRLQSQGDRGQSAWMPARRSSPRPMPGRSPTPTPPASRAGRAFTSTRPGRLPSRRACGAPSSGAGRRRTARRPSATGLGRARRAHCALRARAVLRGNSPLACQPWTVLLHAPPAGRPAARGGMRPRGGTRPRGPRTGDQRARNGWLAH